MVTCRKNDPATLVMPPRSKDGTPPVLKFKNFDRCYWQPFIAFADFESLLVPEPRNNQETGTSSIHSPIIHRHKDFASAYIILDSQGNKVIERLFIQDEETRLDGLCDAEEDIVTDDQARQHDYERLTNDPAMPLSPTWARSKRFPASVNLLLSLFESYHTIKEQLYTYLPLQMSDDEEEQFENQSKCHICLEYFEIDQTDKVRDHDHLTGIFRGAAHSSCNLKYRPSNWLSVFMHNLTSYDSHPIMHGLSHPEIKRRLHKVSVLPITSEKFTTISIETKDGAKIRFADSLRFLNASLDSLSSSLIKSAALPLLEQKFPKTHHLLKGKQFFPYEHMTDISILKETQLPPRQAFYNSLNKTLISESDHKKAKNVFNLTGCKSMLDYVRLYLTVDVILLAEVFQAFRRLSHRVYKLDPCHYVSTPQLAFDAALFKSKVELELMTDIDMILFIQSGIRGGISMISNRHSEANNPLMKEKYDKTKEDKYILYHDINNLYGTAMTMPLPVSGFKWVNLSEDHPSHFDESLFETHLDEFGREVGESRIYEVDIEYPSRLHDDHNDLPLAPEKVFIEDSNMSEFQLNIRDGKRSNVKKLIPHLMRREKYVVHASALQYYRKKGLVVTKIHRILQFTQYAWLKDYVDLNTKLRRAASSSFEKDLFKLFNNSVYGKTIENLWNRKEVKVCWNETQLLKYSDKAWFRCFNIINTDLSICVMKRKKIVLDKPLYLGFTILDYSKRLFYENWYDGYKRIWPGEQSKLLMCDTDSYIMEICTTKNRSVYQDMWESQRRQPSNLRLILDCSNYDPEDEDDYIKKLFNKAHEKELGAVKDEMGSNIVIEFVGLRSKLYGLRYLQRPSYTDGETTKAKGCPKSTLKNSYNFYSFLAMLNDSIKSSTAPITSIRSVKHTLNTIVTKKRCLSIADDKRFILNDQESTLAFGHKKLRAHYNQNRANPQF